MDPNEVSRKSKPSNGALVRRNFLLGLSKFRYRSCDIVVIHKARAQIHLQRRKGPTINRSLLVAEDRIQRLCLFCGEIPSE